LPPKIYVDTSPAKVPIDIAAKTLAPPEQVKTQALKRKVKNCRYDRKIKYLNAIVAIRFNNRDGLFEDLSRKINLYHLSYHSNQYNKADSDDATPIL